MTDDVDQILKTLEAVSRDRPLAHPTAFGMRHMSYACPPPPHLVEIEQAVYEALDPEAYPYSPKNIVRLFPREHGKSETVSHKIPSWLALRDPNVRILIMMESEEQAAGKLEECSTTINRLASTYDREVITDSHTKLTLDREKTHDVPTIRAAGFETSVTGGHYDVIIFDDLVSADSEATELRRDKNWKRFQDYLNLGSAGETVFLVVGTRKHPEDIYSKLISSAGWNVRIEKAIQDWSLVENGEYDIITTNGEVFTAEEKPPGDEIAMVKPHRDVPVLWPELWPLDKLLKKYLQGSVETDVGEDEAKLSGSRVWIRENQNKADALMGQVLDPGMLRFVKGPADDDRSLDDMPHYVGMDLALEPDAEKAANNDFDYFAYAISAYDPRDSIFYVRDVERKRGMSMSQAIDWVEAGMARYPTRNLYVESVQAQRFFAQEAAKTRLYVHEVQNMGKKEDRILAMSAKFENGRAVLVGDRNEPKWDSLVSEWTQFPTGDHDDRLDAMQVSLSGRAMEDEERKMTSPLPFIGS